MTILAFYSHVCLHKLYTLLKVIHFIIIILHGYIGYMIFGAESMFILKLKGLE